MKKVLIIEDASGVRHGTAEILTFEGYEVIEAENGLQGVEIAKKQDPDVVICDIMMPELDGFGVLKELRHNPQTSSTPFIFLTAKSTKEDIEKGLEAGADAYLTKPFTVEELVETVNARLKRKKFEQLLEMPYEKMPGEGRVLMREVAAAPLFAELDVPERQRILKYLYVEDFDAGHVIQYEEKTQECTLFSILSGDLEILRHDKTGQESVIVNLYRGHYFGEGCLFDEQKSGVRVRMRNRCRLLGFTRANFETVIRDEPVIATKIMTVLIKGLFRQLTIAEAGKGSLR